jgi:MFS family permease
VAGNVWSFTVLRVIGMLSLAPIFPLSVASIAQRASGQVIGFVNSARIGASFVGPVLATTLLTWTSPAAVYVIMAALALSPLPLLLRSPAAWRGREEGAR